MNKKKGLVLTVLLALLTASSLCTQSPRKNGQEGIQSEKIEIGEVKNVKITTTYDNYKKDPEMEVGWGFSCLVEFGDEKILFDTGGEPGSLLSNMEKLGIDPRSIDMVFLSHRHWDHAGGLEGFLQKNPEVKVYILDSFPDAIKEVIENSGAEMIKVNNHKKLVDGAVSTGELKGPPEEQSLLISTERGLVVITGCAHPGIVRIVEVAKVLTGKDVYLAMGGFHLREHTDEEIKKVINSLKELGVEKVAPSHCSGDRARELFKEEYGEDFIENGAGKKIEIV